MTIRIAIAGILLEANRFAPATTYSDFEDYMLHRDDVISGMAHLFQLPSALPKDADVEFVPILLAGAESGGPILHEDYERLVNEIESTFQSRGPVDGVFLFAHGAGLTTECNDLDGDYFKRVRQIVGPDVPIVAELDLHANLSDEMVEQTDLLVGYRTNPHVDVAARARECVAALWKLIHGARVHVAFQRLPLITSQISQLTDPGTPYGDAIDLGSRLRQENEGIANVTLLSGFSFSDTHYNGFAVYVATWTDLALAEATCARLSEFLWQNRERFIPHALSVHEAAQIELTLQSDGTLGPRIYADIADNPGGGGRGNTIHLLKAMIESGADGVLASAYFDPALVQAAEKAGIGARFVANFNTQEESSLSGKMSIEAHVDHIFDGAFKNEIGVQAGENTNLGRSCVLSLENGRIKVVVVSLRNQVFNPQFFSEAGLNPSAANALIVKSRGHFRAGFADLAGPANIYEVDAPGLCTSDIASVDWANLPKPTYPLNAATEWTPDVRLKPSTRPSANVEISR
ncbi:MAG: M81 family metallopeptidase [Pseudomonadota bacterium]